MTAKDFVYGFAGLGALLDSGTPMAELGPALEARVARDPSDANAMLDIATLCFLTMNDANRPFALQYQQRALELRQVYRLQPPIRATLRLLVLMAPGDMTSNTPFDCLLEGSDFDVTLLYVLPGRALPDPLPPHDVVFVAIGESSANHVLLRQLFDLNRKTAKPIVNRPDRIARLVRDEAADLLDSAPGILISKTVRIHRTELQAIARGAASVRNVPGVTRFPAIVRPFDSQGGKDLAKIDSGEQLQDYLSTVPGLDFFLARFIDYRSPDGQFRKYRVALVNGRPFPCHLAISDNWLVHYVSAGMDKSPDKRRDEARFFETFEDGFAAKHHDSLAAVHERLGLDYVTLDCAETADGRLVVFEVDNAAIVHSYDDPVMYPYKPPAMSKVFDAFRELVRDRTKRYSAR